MQVMDSMHQPREPLHVFTYSYLYAFTLTLPSVATSPSAASLFACPIGPSL